MLSRIGFYHLAGILEVYRRVGEATPIIAQHRNIRTLIPDASQRLVEAFQDLSGLQKWADAELDWAETHGVDVLCLGDERYPRRLSECSSIRAQPTSMQPTLSVLLAREEPPSMAKILSAGS